MSKMESGFQSHLVHRLKDTFSGCVVIKGNSQYKQGLPDLLILYKDKWAALEVKRSEDASHRPNQDFYINYLSEMSYASFIYPENEEEVFNDLERSFKA